MVIHQRAPYLKGVITKGHYLILNLPVYQAQSFASIWAYLNGLDELHTITVGELMTSEVNYQPLKTVACLPATYTSVYAYSTH